MPRRRIKDVKIYYMSAWEDKFLAAVAADSLVLVPLPATQDRFRIRCGYRGIKILNGRKTKEARITLYDNELPKTKPPFNPPAQMGMIERSVEFKLPRFNDLVTSANESIETAYRRKWQMAMGALVFVAACVFSICYFLGTTPGWLNDIFHVGGAFAWVALAVELTGWIYNQATDEMTTLGQLLGYCSCRSHCRHKETPAEHAKESKLSEASPPAPFPRTGTARSPRKKDHV